MTGKTFGEALEALKAGQIVRREGWNGAHFLYLVPGSEFQVNRYPLNGIFPEGTPVSYGSHIDIFTEAGEARPWLASQADMLAHDWVILGEIPKPHARGSAPHVPDGEE